MQMKKRGTLVLDEDWEVAASLGQRSQSLLHTHAPTLASLIAALVAFRLWGSFLCSALLSMAVLSAVWLWKFTAVDPTTYCPERPAVPGAHWFLGNAPEIMKQLPRFGDWVTEQFEQLGEGFVATAPGGVVSYFYRDPATIKYVLKTNFNNFVKGTEVFTPLQDMLGHGIFVVDGQLWKSQRKVASHLFTMRFLRDHMTQVFAVHARKLCTQLEAVPAGEEVNLSDCFFRLTLDAFVEIAFGIELGCLDSYPEPVEFASAFDSLQKNITERFWNPLWKLDKLLGRGAEKKLGADLKVVNDFAMRIIRERRQVSDQELDSKPDLLSRFMANAKKNNDSPHLLSDEYLRDLVINFVIAGRDTTAQTLSWLFYELDQHTHLVEGIVEESRALMNADGGLQYGVLNDMPHTQACVSEALRLHPPVPIQFKVALNDDVLPDGSKVFAGDIIRMCGYAMARNPAVWGDDAKEYRPDRFLDADGHFITFDASKFFAFNAGPRVCLGKPAAYLEAKMVAAMVANRFRVKVVPGQELTYALSLTLPIHGNRGGMFVTLERRGE